MDGALFPPFCLFDLRPNCGGGNEDNVALLQKVPCRHCYTQCPRSCSRPLPTHVSAGDSWTLTGKSESVFYGVTAPFSRVLVHTRFYALQESASPVLCKLCNQIPLASQVKFSGSSHRRRWAHVLLLFHWISNSKGSGPTNTLISVQLNWFGLLNLEL